ncbi:MAG: hypothetical protein AB7F35_01190 [Acetobacteraceae bacterium]
MIDAARRAEFDVYQRAGAIGADRFIPTPDSVIRAMLEAALKTLPAQEPEGEFRRRKGDHAPVIVSSPSKRRPR